MFMVALQLGPNFITVPKPVKAVKPQPKPRPITRKGAGSKKKK